MIIRGNFTGSIRDLSDDQLRQLRNSCLYRGLHGTARAILRESVRRAASRESVTQAA